MKTLFLVLDTVRADFLGCYGNRWVQTPHLDRLASTGFVFDNHWVGSLPCMPARREFMTGRHNFLDRGWGLIEPFDDVLPVELRKQGVFSHIATDHQHYFELGGGNYHVGFDTWDFHRGQEFDPWVSLVDAPALPEHLGRQHPQNTANRSRQVEEEDFSGPRTVQSAIRWLEDNKNADNWFLQVELFDPHEPFYCPKKYRDLYPDDWDGPLFDWPTYDVVKESPAAVEHIRKCYAALLTMTDHWCGRLFQKLEELHLWDDTLIVFTTDHGTMLGERQYWMKVYMPVYPEIGHIPLIVKPPHARRGARIAAVTQTTDVMPTFLDFHGCSLPPHVSGLSLRPLLEGKSLAEREDIIFGYFGMALNITDGRHLYMRNPVREDGGPLHAYTAMPTAGINGWFPRDLHDRMEMGRYLGHTYNIPLYKIPQPGRVPVPSPGQPSFTGRHELWALPYTSESATLNDPKVEAHFARRMVHHLRRLGAPEEHITRLGLTEFKLMTRDPAITESSEAPVKTGQRLAWGIGSVAEGSVMGANGLMDQVFVIGMGLNAMAIGLARSLPLFVEFVTSPWIGHLSDNTRTRWGRRKPWIVVGLLITAFAMVAMWHPPHRWGMGVEIAYISLMTILLYSVGYTLFTIPYLGMGYELGTKYEERTHIMQWRGYALAATGLLTPWCIKVALLLEGGHSTTWKGTHGVIWVSLGMAVLVLITGMMPVLFCREKAHQATESKVPFLTAAGYTVRNPAFWPLVISNFLKRVGIQITGIFFYYIIIYRTAEGNNGLGATEWALFCNAINGATFLAMYPVVKFTDWFGKQQTLMLFMGLSALTYASIWWTMRPGWWIPLLVTGVCIGVFCNTMPTIVNSMLADVCDEDELRSGHRREAFYGAVFVMTDKMAMAFTTLAQGWLLLASGFVASHAQQSPATIAYWMKWLIVTQPTGFLLGMAFIFFYPITRARARRTRAVLDERHLAKP